jgi:hypothetical protein
MQKKEEELLKMNEELEKKRLARVALMVIQIISSIID